MNLFISQVKKAKFFTILCDEASDSSNKGQMTLVLRFADEENNICEYIKDIYKTTMLYLNLSGHVLILKMKVWHLTVKTLPNSNALQN